MTTQGEQGIRREGVDIVFVEDETRKSNLILEANLLKARGQYPDAADRFAEVARIEERLSEMLLQKGLLESISFIIHLSVPSVVGPRQVISTRPLTWARNCWPVPICPTTCADAYRSMCNLFGLAAYVGLSNLLPGSLLCQRHSDLPQVIACPQTCIHRYQPRATV